LVEISALLIGIGVIVLIATMHRTQRLISLLEEKRPWASIRNLLGFFAVGYLVYLVFMLKAQPFNRDLIIGEMLLLCAVLMFLVVRYASGTIRDIMRLDEFEQLLNTDPLTGLFNRRAIIYLMSQEFRKAQQFGFPLSLAMMELDQFEEFTTVYGRDAGDLVLHETGKMLKDGLRQIDLIGRYGDEEFLCVLPTTAAEGALITGARIRTKIRAVRFIEEGGRLELDQRPDQFRDALEVTASIGVVTVTAEMENPHQAIDAACVALKTARQKGRNRVAAFGETDAVEPAGMAAPDPPADSPGEVPLESLDDPAEVAPEEDLKSEETLERTPAILAEEAPREPELSELRESSDEEQDLFSSEEPPL
jgi:diguanylate cyclase (GGDEF)-like protein